MTSAQSVMQNSRIKSKTSHFTRKEQKLVDRFIVACNSIDKHLKGLTDSNGTLGNVIKESRDRSLITAEDYNTLRTVTALRNVLVHDRVNSRHYPMIPTPPFVEEVERLRDRIRHPVL